MQMELLKRKLPFNTASYVSWRFLNLQSTSFARVCHRNDEWWVPSHYWCIHRFALNSSAALAAAACFCLVTVTPYSIVVNSRALIWLLHDCNAPMAVTWAMDLMFGLRLHSSGNQMCNSQSVNYKWSLSQLSAEPLLQHGWQMTQMEIFISWEII